MDYPNLRRSTTFVTVAGTQYYIPVANAMVIHNIRIPANNRYLRKISLEKLQRFRPISATDTGTGVPAAWYNNEWVGASTQPSAAAVIYVSSNGTETAVTTVTVEGVVGGEIDREVVTLTASASPNATTTKQFSEIHSVSKSAVTVGVVKFQQTNSSGATLATLSPMRRGIRYIQIGLERIPSDAYTCYVKYTPWLPELINDSDVPIISERDTGAILHAAMLYAAEHHGDPDLLASRERKYQDTIDKIRERTLEDKETVMKFSFGDNIFGQTSLLPGDYAGYLRQLYQGW